MAMFHYEATDRTGKTVVGSMDARNEAAVRQRLAQSGYSPTLIEPAARAGASAGKAAAGAGQTFGARPNAPPAANPGPSANGSGYAPPRGASGAGYGAAGGPSAGPSAGWNGGAQTFGSPSGAGQGAPAGVGKSGGASYNLLSGNLSLPAGARRRAGVVVPPQELAQFYRQLAAMLKSGVPVTQAIPQLASGEKNRHLRAALMDMEAAVSQGRPLSDAMAMHPRAFSLGHVGLVKSGEAAGFLDRAVTELAVQSEANWGMQNQFNLTLLYGKFLLLPFFIAIVYLLAHISSLTGAPGGQNEKIAAIIRLAAKAAGFGLLFSVVFNVLVPLLFRYIKGTSLGGSVDAAASRLPFVGATRRKGDHARTLASLASATKAGLPYSQAWNLASEVAEMPAVRESMQQQGHHLNQGMPITEVMAATKVYDDKTLQMARSGELAGNLPEMLEEAANYKREQYNFETKRNSTVVGFLFILAIILCIAFFIIKYWLGYFLGGAAGGMGGGGGEDFLGWF